VAGVVCVGDASVFFFKKLIQVNFPHFTLKYFIRIWNMYFH
jgi:hypothetical protein